VTDSTPVPDAEPLAVEPEAQAPESEPEAAAPEPEAESELDTTETESEPDTAEPEPEAAAPESEATEPELEPEPDAVPANIYDDPRDGIFDEFQATMDRGDHPFMQLDAFCHAHDPAPDRVATDPGMGADSISLAHIRSRLEDLVAYGFASAVGDVAEIFPPLLAIAAVALPLGVLVFRTAERYALRSGRLKRHG